MKRTIANVARILFAITILSVAVRPVAVSAIERPKPPKSVPARLFVGYAEEQEIEIVATVATGKEDTGPLVELTGNHYWTQRRADGTSQSRLELWLSAAAGLDARSEVLLFCRSIDPGIILSPDFKFPVEISDLRARVRPTTAEWSGDEFHITFMEPLIPGDYCAYVVDGRTGTWSSRTFHVGLAQ
jgi:hypothetical protein